MNAMPVEYPKLSTWDVSALLIHRAAVLAALLIQTWSHSVVLTMQELS